MVHDFFGKIPCSMATIQTDTNTAVNKENQIINTGKLQREKYELQYINFWICFENVKRKQIHRHLSRIFVSDFLKGGFSTKTGAFKASLVYYYLQPSETIDFI